MKKNSRLIGILSFAIFQMLFKSLAAQMEQHSKRISVVLNTDVLHEITIELQAPGEYKISTTGTDPYLFTEKFIEEIPADHFILSFEYFCPTWLDHLQIFFADPVDENKSIHTELGVSEGWTTFSLDVKEQMKGWGKKGDYIRFDFGAATNYRMQVRNICFRKPTTKEAAITASRERNKMKDAKMATNLENYLNKKFSNTILNVSIEEKEVLIKAKIHPGKNFYLAELPLYQDITERHMFDHIVMLPPGKNEVIIRIDRFVRSGDKNYDRLLSKWVIVEKKGNQYSLASHARYPDKIKSLYNLPDEKPWNKKGIGGFSAGGRAPVSDLDSLNISSVTINIWITRFIHAVASEATMPYSFNGKKYFIDRKAVEGLDKTLQVTASRKIIVSAIILIGKASTVPDKEIGRIFEHPDFDPAGIYSMANVTSAEGLEYYAAIMDFLAARYSRPDKMYGRIHHWIMHNEVDAGWVWTNMGEKPPLLFMDDYIKSMRVVYNIARKYNHHSKVFISLTHYWTWTADRHYYHPKELLEILLHYSKAEGDFDWAIAQHPYPESLFEPKSWLDKRCDFSFNTPLITYKNIEVLNAWVNLPATFYLGKFKRIIHLSEQGVNSMDYSEKSLNEQAAGMAYAWKKIKNLENIEAFQYHNWMDNRGEGGLRIGLRRFPNDETDPAGKKPVWNVYRDMGTNREEQAFEFAKEIIGIDNWDEVIYKGEIDSVNRKQSYKDLKSDTWVTKDVLSRSLFTGIQTVAVKKNRKVGIFYFPTATTKHNPQHQLISR